MGGEQDTTAERSADTTLRLLRETVPGLSGLVNWYLLSFLGQDAPMRGRVVQMSLNEHQSIYGVREVSQQICKVDATWPGTLSEVLSREPEELRVGAGFTAY